MGVFSQALSRGRSFGLAAFIALASTPAASADTAIATRWRLLGQSQGDCMVHAEVAIMRIGFNKSERGSQSMSGKHGDYTVSIRCVSEQNIVFFVTSGPSPEIAARYVAVLYGLF